MEILYSIQKNKKLSSLEPKVAPRRRFIYVPALPYNIVFPSSIIEADRDGFSFIPERIKVEEQEVESSVCGFCRPSNCCARVCLLISQKPLAVAEAEGARSPCQDIHLNKQDL